MVKGRQKFRVETRDLVCFWTAYELGILKTELAKKLDMTVSGAGYAVSLGEKIANRLKYRLADKVI